MTGRKRRPRIHITAVGGSAAEETRRLGVGTVKGMVALAQSGVGDRYEVTASERMLRMNGTGSQVLTRQ